MVEVGLITETRRGQGKTNIINIVSMSGDQIEEDTKEVEELEPKSVEVLPIYCLAAISASPAYIWLRIIRS